MQKNTFSTTSASTTGPDVNLSNPLPLPSSTGKPGQPSQEVINFIRAEFARPLDLRAFAWSIPLGLEEKIYALSLSVMEVDTREESGYLSELAHGLRLSPEICRQLHQQLGARPPGP